ncbi:hypothetical protein I316_04195 [Kwoniella heveanensis BCC8398]|uniref:SCA7 domain-containing protein n=1 Tax=Kwoniella heveanensis BCC8398 TaxID=1296120 RepID=A0A1B9GT44_9TREE|nr:hypothetical protein I316_04195 [Kwoniella heveanensis BCC8398]
MPLTLKPRSQDESPLAPFTFSLPSPPSDVAPPPAVAAAAAGGSNSNNNENATASSSTGTGASTIVAGPPRPPAAFIPEKDMYMFGTYPLLGAGEIGTGRVRCRRCGKVTLEWAAGEHRRICNHVLDGTPLTTKKMTKASKTTEMNKKRRASEASDHQTSPKKRAKFPPIASLAESTEAEDDDLPLHSLSHSNSNSQSFGGLSNAHSFKGLKKAEAKKLEKEKMRIERKEAKEKERMEIAERKRMRASNPINLDRQCGVINDKSTPCARSLTCKTHTVGAKRAVQGRTRPYDELYLEWQREHNPNFKEPVRKDPKEKERELERKRHEAALNKKKKNKSGASSRKNNDDVLEEDEDGFRELEELIGMTRLAGERVRGSNAMLGQLSASNLGGSSPAPIPIATIGPNGIPKLNPAAAAQNSANAAAAAAARNSASAGGTLSGTNTSNGAGANGNGKNGAGAAGGSSKFSLNGQNRATIPFQAIWRSSASEFASVGAILTKALAARPAREPTTGGAGSSVGGGGAVRGAGSAASKAGAVGGGSGLKLPMLNSSATTGSAIGGAGVGIGASAAMFGVTA